MRVTFLIDGFNLYHSIEQAGFDSNKKCKWLDIKSLLSSYLPQIGKQASIEEIYFFTAIRYHVQNKNPDTVKRHEQYLKMLQNTGIEIIKGKFKKGKGYCSSCKNTHPKYEEKETDVNIAVKLIELGYLDSADVFVIVSGDTDLLPGIKVLKKLFPHKKVFVLFPYKRKNEDVKKYVDGTFKMNSIKYDQHQFADPYIIESTSYSKPSHW